MKINKLLCLILFIPILFTSCYTNFIIVDRQPLYVSYGNYYNDYAYYYGDYFYRYHNLNRDIFYFLPNDNRIHINQRINTDIRQRQYRNDIKIIQERRNSKRNEIQRNNQNQRTTKPNRRTP